MKKTALLMIITVAAGLVGCKSEPQAEKPFEWVVDRFDDIKVLRYQVPDFDTLSLDEKKLIYYLNQAALCGRDILFDQNGRYNLRIRRTLEAIEQGYTGDRNSEDFKKFEKYLKKVWFANGIHHHYSLDKFLPEFSESYFDELIAATPAEYFPQDFKPSVEAVIAEIKPVMFDPTLFPKRTNQAAGADMIATSANNYYEGLTQQEVEDYYKKIIDPNDSTPISYGLNSKLMKENGQIVEKTWKVGGMYSAAIEQIVYWLEQASTVAKGAQKQTIDELIGYYRSGNLSQFDTYSISWVQDTLSKVDFVNGFIETYGDPLGYRASWEGLVNFRDEEATRRTETISAEAQWFEDHSPIDPKYRKEKVKGVSAKVITAAILGGDCYPATPIGINLPNADWIRKDYGSKSVTIENITHAYNEAAKGNGFLEEFIYDPADIELQKRYGELSDNLHTDLHECLGHGSGQLAPGVKTDALKNYGSTLEEARADLFALYYLGDPKLVELGLVPSFDAAKAQYLHYILNGMMTQLARIQPGKDVEEAHMRNRMLIAMWCYEKGQQGEGEPVIKKVTHDGKTYIEVTDYERLRELFGELLREIQRIKSEGDYEAGKALVETYGVKVDQKLHDEVLARYGRLGIEPYSGFVNPVYKPVMENGQIVDVKVEYNEGYIDQMLRYSKDYSFLPSVN